MSGGTPHEEIREDVSTETGSFHVKKSEIVKSGNVVSRRDQMSGRLTLSLPRKRVKFTCAPCYCRYPTLFIECSFKNTRQIAELPGKRVTMPGN